MKTEKPKLPILKKELAEDHIMVTLDHTQHLGVKYQFWRLISFYSETILFSLYTDLPLELKDLHSRLLDERQMKWQELEIRYITLIKILYNLETPQSENSFDVPFWVVLP